MESRNTNYSVTVDGRIIAAIPFQWYDSTSYAEYNVRKNCIFWFPGYGYFVVSETASLSKFVASTSTSVSATVYNSYTWDYTITSDYKTITATTSLPASNMGYSLCVIYMKS